MNSNNLNEVLYTQDERARITREKAITVVLGGSLKPLDILIANWFNPGPKNPNDIKKK